MTPDEITASKAERAKRPLAERLADVVGHRVESQPEQAQAEVSFEDVKRMQESKLD